MNHQQPYHIFLDDNRKPTEVTWIKLPLVEWTIVRSYEEFFKTIEKRGIPKTISYDCDLCDEHYQAYHTYSWKFVLKYQNFKTPCGIHVIQRMLEICKKLKIKHPNYFLHTSNKHAIGYMDRLIKRHNKDDDRRLIIGGTLAS